MGRGTLPQDSSQLGIFPEPDLRNARHVFTISGRDRVGRHDVAIRSPGRPAQSPATSDNAAAFIGSWALSLDGPMGPLDLDLTLAAEDGGVSGSLAGDRCP